MLETKVEGAGVPRLVAGHQSREHHVVVVALAEGVEVGQAVEVRLRTTFTGEFDQAGVFVKADNEHWVKSGLEFADGVLNLGAVVTIERSDWSVAPVDWNGREVTVKGPDDAPLLWAIRDEAGRPYRVVGLDTDVTDLRRLHDGGRFLPARLELRLRLRPGLLLRQAHAMPHCDQGCWRERG